MIDISNGWERGVGCPWKGASQSFQGQLAFVIAGLSILLFRETLSSLEREKDVMCIYWGAICASATPEITLSQTILLFLQLYNSYTRVEPSTGDNSFYNAIGDYQKTPQQMPWNTGRSLPAAESQHEDQKSNIPDTNKVRSYQAQASSHPLRAPVGLEILSCTAAPTCLSSLYRRESKGPFNTLSLQGTDRRW